MLRGGREGGKETPTSWVGEGLPGPLSRRGLSVSRFAQTEHAAPCKPWG